MEKNGQVIIPDYADVITFEEFQDYVRMGAFIPDDGDGYYATETHMWRYPSVWDGSTIPHGTTHIAWFNK